MQIYANKVCKSKFNLQKFSTMGKINQNALTVRFLADYDKAWKSGLFKTQAEFCEKTGADKASLSLVLNGSRNAPMSLIQKLKSIYDSEETPNDPNMDAKEKEIEMLRELLKSKEEIIKSKDETIEALRGQSRSDYKGKSRLA